jgi:hypothetical protein
MKKSTIQWFCCFFYFCEGVVTIVTNLLERKIIFIFVEIVWLIFSLGTLDNKSVFIIIKTLITNLVCTALSDINKKSCYVIFAQHMCG